MANNIVLGSGLIGRLALDIRPDCSVIPFGKSRFYSFYPSLGEEYIIKNSNCDEYIRKYYGNMIMTSHIYRRAFSTNGLITSTPNQETIDEYINKVHQCNSKLMSLLIQNTSFEVYDITANVLFQSLKRFDNKILDNNLKFGKLNKIDVNNHIIHTSTGSFDYDNIISTIPLNALQNFCGIKPVTGRPVTVYDIISDDLDFEGNDELFVSDSNIDFYLVRNISSGRYMFFSLNDIKYPEQYFSLFFKNFKILATTTIDDYLSVGDIPNVNIENINCIGSCARWDYFYDISTAISKLLKLNI